MTATGVWFGNEQWPTGRSPGDFARDVFRLENAKTDKAKAFAFYKWMLRCMNRGPNLYVPSGAGGYARCFNPLEIFTWGSHECTGWGWVAAEALNAAGLKARRMVANENGHTFYEIWYKGDDGKAQWHAFDPFLGWYFLNKDGEVASTAELGADPNLVHAPCEGHADPCGHDWMRAKFSRRATVHDWLDVVQEVKNERLAYDLVRGQTMSALWRPAQPDQALITYNAALPGERGTGFAAEGSHCDITPRDYEGRIRYPEHEAFWKPYRWPSTRDPRALVRWHGSGFLKWTPLLYGAEAAVETHNARFENNRVGPVATNTYMEVWYRIKLPYHASYLAIDTSVRGHGEAGFCISTDGGRTVWPLKQGRAPFGGMIENGKADYIQGKPSIQGVREFLLRIDMLAGPSADNFCVEALRILVGFHHNMHVQPRFLPGDNNLYLEAAALGEGRRLSVRWDYSTPDGEDCEALELDKAGRAESSLVLPWEQPDEVVMRGVTVGLA